jgi:hypothetical protein
VAHHRTLEVLELLPHVLRDTLPVLQHAAEVKLSHTVSLISGLPGVAVRLHGVGLAVGTVAKEHYHRQGAPGHGRQEHRKHRMLISGVITTKSMEFSTLTWSIIDDSAFLMNAGCEDF